MRVPRKIHVDPRVLLLIFATCLSLALVEVSLRLLGITFDASLYGYDDVTGWRLRPGAHGWWVSEGHAYVRINRDGMNDRDYALLKPRNGLRIAVLGDSMTSAVQVDVERNFLRVLERNLSTCHALTGRPIEVMNFGVPGFGTAQELLTFQHKVVQYSPDIVLLAFFTYNDVQNNHRALNPVNSAEAPYFVLEGNRLVLDDSFRQQRSWKLYGVLRDAFGDLANRSRIIQAAAEVILRRGLFARARQAEAGAIAQRFGKHADALIYGPPTWKEMAEAWQVTEALLLRLAQEAEARDIGFWLVTLSQSPQVLADPVQRAAIVQKYGIQDLFYPDRRLERFARRHGIPAIVLAPELARYAEVHQAQLTLFPDGSGHYNELGHRIIGTMIGERLCQAAQATSGHMQGGKALRLDNAR